MIKRAVEYIKMVNIIRMELVSSVTFMIKRVDFANPLKTGKMITKIWSKFLDFYWVFTLQLS